MTDIADFNVKASLGNQGLKATVESHPHTYYVDEPVEVGGTDEAPTPYDYLLGALGSCTVMTLHIYAKHKGWPLEKAEVWLRHGRFHESDCENCEDESAKIDQIQRKIKLHGPLSDEQKKRMEIIANKCPVHKTLTKGIHINTELI